VYLRYCTETDYLSSFRRRASHAALESPSRARRM